MSTQLAEVQSIRPSLIASMAAQRNMEPAIFAKTVKATCMPGNVSDEEFAAFLMVAHRYGLDPVTREIYAFPKKGGGIQPIVGIDGWSNLINSHPACDGIEFKDEFSDDKKLVAITCLIHRKDRTHPTMVTEYMDECRRQTEPWQKWPARMLRHKALIQCARYAFGFAGIIDQEEAERSPEVITETVAPPPPAIAAPVEDAIDVEPFDVAKFLADLKADLAAASSEELVNETWDGYAVEEKLTDEANLQAAFDAKSARLAELSA